MQNVPLLLGAQCSRYSARVRSYLIKKDIAFVERVPTAWTFQVTIRRRFGDAAVPVLILPDGEWLADSELILDRLEAQHPRDPIQPPDPLHAFVACSKDGPSTEEIIKQLSGKIPSYMMPYEVVKLDSLPKTSTGKIDRVGLKSQEGN